MNYSTTISSKESHEHDLDVETLLYILDILDFLVLCSFNRNIFKYLEYMIYIFTSYVNQFKL